ncbi:MAG: hypothetical protein HKO57_14235, partial [Akkermansiaceae bacterium]|nr:hypothetical protein [Akkermansiaceae bacterium]
LAWRGVAGGLGASNEAAYRQSIPGEADIPTSAETEREASLMSLPIYLHGIAQFPVFEGKDFLEIPGARATILAHPPASTDWFLREFESVEALCRDLERRADAPPDAPPAMPPDIPDPTLVESLGALGARLLFERHGDFAQASTLAARLEADIYVLFSTGTGDHLRWTARFAAPRDAEQARALLTAWLEQDSPSSDPRSKQIVVDGATLVLSNESGPAGE